MKPDKITKKKYYKCPDCGTKYLAAGYASHLAMHRRYSDLSKRLLKFIGTELELIQMPAPSHGYDYSKYITLGRKYLVVDVEVGNFWFICNDGRRMSLNCERFMFD